MKRTDMEKKEREQRRAAKKALQQADRLEKRTGSVGDYIKRLEELLFHDDVRIYNAKEDIKILELVEEMQESLDEEQCVTVFRKAIKKTGVKEREQALEDLKGHL